MAQRQRNQGKERKNKKKTILRENDFTSSDQGIAVKVGNFAGRLVKNCKRQALDNLASIPL